MVDWLRANKISLNASKTEIILFRNKNKRVEKRLNFRLSGQQILPVKQVTYLGVALDEHLSWNIHIPLLTKKLSRTTGILAKLRHYVSYKTLLSVYYALFSSHIGYSIQSWGHVSNEDMNKISKLQNKALRIIHFKSNKDPSQSLYLQSKLFLFT